MTEDQLVARLKTLRRRFFKPPVIVSSRQDLPSETSAARVAAAEARLGLRFPPLLRRLYTEVANGGFGPGYGLLGIEDGHTRKTGRDVVGEYLSALRSDPEDTEWKWPLGVVPLFDWGGFTYSCADFTRSEAPIVEFDPTLRADGEPMAKAFRPQEESLRKFLERWIEGEDVSLERRVFSEAALRRLAEIEE